MSEFNDDELAFLYLLNELDPEDTERVDVRLAHRDPDMLTALEAAERTAGSFPNSLTPVSPRPELKQELMARVDLTPKMRAQQDDQQSERIVPVRAINSNSKLNDDTSALSVDWKIAAMLLFGFGVASFASLRLWQDRDRLVAEQLAQDSGRVERAESGLHHELEESRARTRGLLAELNESEQARVEAEEELASAREAIRRLSEASTPEIVPNVDTSATLRLRETLAMREAEIAAMQEQLADLSQSSSVQGTEFTRQQMLLAESLEALELVSAPDVGIVDLFAPEPSSQDSSQKRAASSASVYWDRGLTNCYFQARALPDLTDRERYATWLRYENGSVVRVADFTVDQRGDATFYAPLPKGNGEIAATFVTREAAGGAERPSEQIVLEEIVPTGEPAEGDSNSRRRYRRRNT